ncbi:MAG: hypothetical protein K0R58_2352 [Ramlibacter sp.]|jgi:hypothetical protein|nr:hypothetical protein [Ramlibacter sp.]
MKRRVFAIALLASTAALVSGCATGPKFDQVQSSLPQLAPGTGRIFVYRQSTMVGAALAPEIRLNGQPVGHAGVGSFFYVDRPAGTYSISASGDTERSLSFALAPGEIKYIRMYVNMGLLAGNVAFELNAAAKGQADLASLSYSGKTK